MSLSGARLPQAFRNLTTAAISPASPPSAQNAMASPLSRTSSNQTSHRGASKAAAISTASSVLSLVGEVSTAVADVPYVGAIATVVATLIKIREEIETKEERCQELLDRVLNKIERIFTHLLDLKGCDDHSDLRQLETEMQRYHKFLTEVIKTVTKLQERPLYQRIFDRGTNELEKLNRIINDFDSNLILDIVMKIMKTSTNQARNYGSREMIQDANISTHFPAAPVLILEREEQHRKIVARLISTPDTRVALLGMGGIGKTTLACSIARDPEITEVYPRRLFLSFEGCSTSDLAYTNIAAAFETPHDQRVSYRQIMSHVLSHLRQERTLFVIDNFETWWEVPGNRRVAEDFLSQLSSLQELAMIVTLRGIQRPAGITWFKARPLPTLTQHASMDLLSAVTEEKYTDNDLEHVRKLLDAVAGIPLAITLIGTLLRDELETPQSLWNQWTRESARAIRVANEPGSDDRLYRLDISLRLSIFGPRMTEDARRILAAISILPTGLNMDEEWLDKYQNLLSNEICVRDCIRTLRNVALATLDSSTSPNRLRLLPPVRDFCLKNLSLDNEAVRKLIDIYNTDVGDHYEWAFPENYVWITAELSNLTAILHHAIALRYASDEFGRAISDYADWRRFLCMPDPGTVQRAIAILSEYPPAQAKCLQGLGATLVHFNQEQDAIPPLEQALSIHRDVGRKDEEGWDLYLLGDIHARLRNYAKAEHYLNEAKDLFIEVGDKARQGSAVEKLASLYHNQKKLPEAERAAKEALEISRATCNRKGEATALNALGRVYEKQGNYELAIEKLTASRDASQANHDIYMEALGNEDLGYVYLAMYKPDQAAFHLGLAISLFERAQQPRYAEDIRVLLMGLGVSLDSSE